MKPLPILLLASALSACASAPEPISVRAFPTARYAFFQSPRGGGDAAGFAIAVDALGRVVVAGTAEDPSGKRRAALWRFEDAGRLDVEFGDRGFAIARSEGEALSLSFSKDGSILAEGTDPSGGGIAVRFDHKGNVLEERAAPEFRAPAAPKTPFPLPLDAGTIEQGVAASARTGKVLRYAGFVKTQDGVRAALWGVKGDDSRIRLLPGGDGGEDRALALAAYENGRLAAAGFSRGAGGKRRLAIWSVP